MLIEYVEGGQLYDEILKRKPKENGTGYFSERMAGKIVGELTDAIRHMHAQDVIHCDLKPENVLCTHNPSTDNFDIKVADMGLSKVLERGVHQNLTYCGTPLYMAPEMLRKEQYSYPVDMWSIGCMMHELMCGDPPFTGKNMMELERNVKSFKGLFGDETAVTKRIQRQFKRYGVSPKAQELIGLLLDPSPSSRITAPDAMAHEWISKNEELSADHMGEVHLSLQVATEKRKFRRTINKIILGQRIIRTIKYSQPHRPKAVAATTGKGHSDAKQPEEAGCNCVLS
jgi:serine/threonine protein kinase